MKPLNPKINNWSGQHVWVIGASTGIGAATVAMLLAQGAHVTLSARNEERLRQVAADAGAGPATLIVPLDVCEHASVQRAAAAILAQWPRIDLVLIVAGGYNKMRADSFDLAAASALIDLNLRGVFHCLDVVLPQLLRQGAGGIGIVASVAGYGGLPKALVYGPTKAALINLTESLYFDLHPRGIGVYQINPGFVDTPLTAGNDFKMPALMSAQDAAAKLLDGLQRGQFHIHFPRRFTNFLRLAQLLPYRMYFWLIRKVTGL
ncbi:MAG: NAD(P)-dependent dehydrogenase (short-subunit alcohol dehydrogenase family) [Janthinobacterium sp.]|jgi:NAD(P)-dependent dehydrogenase (short-subunit alcohol dehydrogenase family)